MHVWTPEMEKRCQSRVITLLSNPTLYRVMQRFGIEVFRRSSIFMGLDEFLSANNISGKVCFEIGSWNGLTAVVLSRYFERVISVDIVNNPLKHEITKYLGIDTIRFLDIKNNKDKAKVAKEWEFDFAYLDGDHAADTEDDWKLVKHCQHVLFHECWRQQPPVWNLVASLPQLQVSMNGDGLAYWDGTKPTAVEKS